jgi:hypothetical protein
MTIAVDANKADFRESAGAAASLLQLDLANNVAGIGTAPVSGYSLAVAAPLNLTAITAGGPNFKITKTSDTPVTTYTAHVPSTDPAGYIEILEGANVRYIPFYT